MKNRRAEPSSTTAVSTQQLQCYTA